MARQLGDFLLEDLIGEGGMGEVWRARQLSLDRLVAVKILPQRFAADRTLVERFTREAKAAAGLVHPNVIQIHAFGVEDGTPYFAMEFVEGENLGDRLKRVGKLKPREAARLATGVALALQAAHEFGVVHRDIKPSNIMLDNRGMVKVLDFGLAKLVSEPKDDTMTRSGTFMGTPRYASPEQVNGRQELDVRSDIYGLGIVLYECVTGRHPFEAESDFAIIHKHVTQVPMAPSILEPSVPQLLERLILRMLAKDPRDRFRTPKLLLADLKRLRGQASPSGSRAGDRSSGSPPAALVPPPDPLTAPEVPPEPEPVLLSSRWDYVGAALLVLLIGSLGAAMYVLLGVVPLEA